MNLTPEAILGQLSKLPPDKDPYCWLADYLRLNYLPHYSTGAKVQIYLVVALLASDVVVVLYCLYLRIRKGQLWFFRRHISGTLLQPNLAFVGGSLGLVILGVTIFLYLTVVKASDHHFPLYMGYVSLLLGVFPGLVGEFAIWSLTSSFLIHLHCQDPNRLLNRWIHASNVFGIAAPVLHLSIFLPLDVVAGFQYSKTVQTFFRIDKALRLEGSKWYKSTENQNLSGLATIAPLFGTLVKEFEALRPIWQANYIFEAITTVLLVVAVSIIASLYFSSVKRLICRAQHAYQESGRGRELLDEVYRTWIGLVASIVLFLIIAAITFGLSLFSAIRPLILSQAYILVSFWSQTLLAMTMTGIFFWLSWILEPISNMTPKTTVEGSPPQIVTWEEQKQSQRLSKTSRRRSSIWFEELYYTSHHHVDDVKDQQVYGFRKLGTIEESDTNRGVVGGGETSPSTTTNEDRDDQKFGSIDLSSYSITCTPVMG